MATIFLYDERVTTNAVKADLVMCVNQNDNILLKIQELAKLVQSKFVSLSPGWAHELRICCTSANEGLLLGSGINHQNIAEVFAALKFKVGNIIIEGCNATLVYRHGNNGITMCKKLAHAVYANVIASNSTNSNTVTWNQSGNLNSIQEFDNSGQLLHSVQHPGAHALNQYKRSCQQAKMDKKSTFSVRQLTTGFMRKCNQLLIILHISTPHTVKVAVRH